MNSCNRKDDSTTLYIPYVSKRNAHTFIESDMQNTFSWFLKNSLHMLMAENRDWDIFWSVAVVENDGVHSGRKKIPLNFFFRNNQI